MPPQRFTKEQERAIREVGRTLRKAREAMGLQGTDVAAMAGISTHTLYRAENGYVNVNKDGESVQLLRRASADTVMAVAKVLDLDGAALCEKLGLTVPHRWRTGEAVAKMVPASIEVQIEGLMRTVDQVRAALEALRRELPPQR